MTGIDLQTKDVVARLTNQTGAAEGSIVPPRQAGAFRVPFVTNLKVETSQQLVGTTLYTLTWDEPDSIPNSQLAYFNVYATTVATTGTTPTAPVTVYRSPAQISVAAAQNSVIVFQVQTVLTSGLCSDLQSSPSCTQTVAASQISASQINASNLLVNNLTLTNNSPSAGNIAWSAHTIYYQGTPYAIASGNTTVTTNKFLIWNIGDVVLTSVVSYTPSPTIFLIATNTLGVGDTAWNKVAQSHVQETQLSVSLLKGFSFQAPASATINMATPGTTNILNITGAGALLTTGAVLTTAASGPLIGQVDLQLQFSADGAAFQTLDILGNDSAGVMTFQSLAKGMSSSISGTGGSASDSMSIYYGITFNTNLIVRAFVPTNTTQGTGSVSMQATWAMKVS